MELKKLLKVPRSARTVAITIVVPESSQPTSAPVSNTSKPAGWHRTWDVLKIAVPTAGSIVAIVISVLALGEQKSADQYQQQTNQREAASLVSFLQTYTNNETMVQVENLGTSTISDPSLFVDADGYFPSSNRNSKGQWQLKIIDLNLSDIPPCSSTAINVYQAIDKFTTKEAPPFSKLRSGMTAVWINFTDGSGLHWRYLSTGGLQPLTISQFYSDPWVYAAWDTSITYQTASGCA